MAIPCMLLFHLFFYLWYLAYLLELWCLDSMPRFHDSSFIYDGWHSAFWNYVASILCSFFLLRYVHSEFWNYAASISRFQFHLRHLHSTFWNYVASIPCSFFHLRYLKFCIPHSGIMLPRFYVPFFSRYVHSGIMSPRFHNH